MLIALIVFAAAAVMFTAELLAPGRTWPKVSGWWGRAIALNLVQVGVVFLAGMTWDVWLDGISLIYSQAFLGTNGAAVFGYLMITFIYYWWHRARHEVGFLWRWFHQIHHSPQRLEIITSFYKHPAEILINGMLSSLILYVICGLRPESAMLAILLTGLAELFYHWNVRTPYWMGFIIQRPESHCIHHKQGWHRQNYADLPIWDMLFGTFHNPRSFDEECGFADDREKQLGAMLGGRDVHADKETASG
ncbi:sterol desaturase family protein [Altererythrobacter sp. ZODW24]|uniref:sterol desaturase family protein n=1 Tax=Altererythrobacter sp. ZODW24 TaxID=2185142 RepID=UPI000DF7511A|nr:sterol desaturase family protein [Altererythrobacter sp. ZODW24]